MVRVPRILDSALLQCPVLDSFLFTSSSFSLSAAASHIEEILDKMVISSEDWSESSFFQWFDRQFWPFAQTLCCLVCSSLHLCLSASPKHNNARHSLSLLVLTYSDTLTTSIGIWDDAGATRSWLHSATLKKSCALISKTLTVIEIFFLGDERNAQRWQWHTNWRYKKISADDC